MRAGTPPGRPPLVTSSTQQSVIEQDNKPQIAPEAVSLERWEVSDAVNFFFIILSKLFFILWKICSAFRCRLPKGAVGDCLGSQAGWQEGPSSHSADWHFSLGMVKAQWPAPLGLWLGQEQRWVEHLKSPMKKTPRVSVWEPIHPFF